MEIVEYTPKLRGALTEFYNRQTVNVPHCYPVKEEEFALAIETKIEFGLLIFAIRRAYQEAMKFLRL